ncbi:hypothetical protein ACYB9B_25755 [Klebsiella pneumoniae]|uniref:hypothetical protein n=1 Tax=Klebsiella pneumoniae complex TaxID=3390273 RepID=UPI000BD4697F|nr:MULTISPECIES: hypothetical protein [Klebsiella]ELA2117825.1 hypothetical protein [Klebsiella pneumoniae]MBW5526962.1 hypothetical protein [Klebsiella pneumoniae]MCH0786283.1 hypothetical protein [Klebsiella pneumoniae]MCP6428562.1 hypothetical protein [Klebsiella pneumoniae]MCP6662992.1 hypothetical protein [Klebsiella pneumoniae]
MTDIYYPHDYLPMPLQEGYGFQPVSPLKRTQLTTGRARQRRAYTSTPTQASVSWFMETDGQAQVFEAWYREKITDGADWFFMKLQTPLGVEFYKCRFTDIYEGPTLVAPIYWKFTATLELWKRPVLPDGWVDFPDFIVSSDILDLAVNREWPKA